MHKLRVLVITSALLMTACQTGSGVTMWGPCDMSADVTGTDGSYALVCRAGTWEPVMTVDEFVSLAKGRRISIGKLPTRPAPTTTSTTTTTTSSTTTSGVSACVESCDGANLTAAVNRQPSGVWGEISGTGLLPGATVTLCDSVAGCYPYTTVSSGGTFSLGPAFCCDASRSSFYAISTTAANGRTITSNSVSH